MGMDWEPLLRNLVTWRGRFGLHRDSHQRARTRGDSPGGIPVGITDEWRKTPSSPKSSPPSLTQNSNRPRGRSGKVEPSSHRQILVADRRDLSTIGFSGSWLAAATLLQLSPEMSID